MYGEVVGINFKGDFWGYGFNFALPYDKLSNLLSREQTYDLEDDYYSYHTEIYWTWDKYTGINDYINRAIQAWEDKLYSKSIKLCNRALETKNQLYQNISGYYPKYSEVKHLKQLKIDSLYAFRDLAEYHIKISNYPNTYSQDRYTRFSNNYNEAYSEHTKELEKLEERFND